MAEIITIPDYPAIGRFNKPKKPVVLLFGRPRWQPQITRELDKSAGVIIKSDVELAPKGPMHPVRAWASWLEYFEMVDIIFSWCGNADEAFYLDQWTYFGWALTKYPYKILAGFELDSDHPMANGLKFLMQELQMQFVLSLDAMSALAQERCRQLRSVLSQLPSTEVEGL